MITNFMREKFQCNNCTHKSVCKHVERFRELTEEANSLQARYAIPFNVRATCGQYQVQYNATLRTAEINQEGAQDKEKEL